MSLKRHELTLLEEIAHAHTTPNPRKAYQTVLKHLRDIQKKQFVIGTGVHHLLRSSTRIMDHLLTQVWRDHELGSDMKLALVATGGYGRRELHPHSDVDILILSSQNLSDDAQKKLSHFLRFLWDLGLPVAQQVQTLKQCLKDTASDHILMTTYMDSRFLCGYQHVYQQFRDKIRPQYMWDSRAFFEEKWTEQRNRHHKFGETAYSLEPNVKNSPGGLRDIQTLVWISRRHFHSVSLKALIRCNFITVDEYKSVMACRQHLWKIRFALHIHTGRKEDRLLFDHQKPLAKLFGYEDKAHNLAIEQFMKDYYQTVHELRVITDMLLQSISEALLGKDKKQRVLNDHFISSHQFLDIRTGNVFIQTPHTILDIFVCLAKNPDLKSLSANAVRHLRQARYLIDEDFRKNPKHQALFIDMLHTSENVDKQLQLMNRYEILSAYIPQFAHTIGQMQYDLFHMYTVDQHSIFLVRNIRRFYNEEYAQSFPLAHQIIKTIAKPEVMYLAALFHDIGKGRQGDHSIIGAEDAEQFCTSHNLDEDDRKLVVWLVRNHLVMSFTAQQRDIYDPETVHEFVGKVQSQRYLDHIYLLTVADICATNPNLWNSWKDTLLRELYRRSLAIIHKQESKPDREILLRNKQADALRLLRPKRFSIEAVKTFWQNLEEDYFIRESVETIANQTKAILEHQDNPAPLVIIRPHSSFTANLVFIYCQKPVHPFATCTTVFANHGLNIAEAHINTLKNNDSLTNYIILDERNMMVDDEARSAHLQKQLVNALEQQALPRLRQRKISRRMQHFKLPIKIAFHEAKHRQCTVMQISCSDRPALLAHISRALLDCNIRILTAKITTIGERVEDVFYITDEKGRPVEDADKKEHIVAAITKAIESIT